MVSITGNLIAGIYALLGVVIALFWRLDLGTAFVLFAVALALLTDNICNRLGERHILQRATSALGSLCFSLLTIVAALTVFT